MSSHPGDILHCHVVAEGANARLWEGSFLRCLERPFVTDKSLVEFRCKTYPLRDENGENWVAPQILRLGYERDGMNVKQFLLLASLSVCPINASAQSVDEEHEPAAIIELGAAAGRDLKGGGLSLGPNLAVEVTPIENWLELEAGTSALFRRHSTEWDTDLLFKKPWTLSEKVEFMVGAGPEWINTRAYGVTSNSLGGEVVLDFMFWPSSKHRFGWYLEPGCEYDFARGHERSIGVSGGLLIGIP